MRQRLGRAAKPAEQAAAVHLQQAAQFQPTVQKRGVFLRITVALRVRDHRSVTERGHPPQDIGRLRGVALKRELDQRIA